MKRKMKVFCAGLLAALLAAAAATVSWAEQTGAAETVVVPVGAVEAAGGAAAAYESGGQAAGITGAADGQADAPADQAVSSAADVQVSASTGAASVQTTVSAPAASGPGAKTRPPINGVSIYVSKRGNTLTLKQYGREIGTWPAKLGRQSSSGDKVQEGDEITPSGSFYVCTRNDKSLYYLALGLSYPSAEDAERGLEAGIITQEQYQAIIDANKAKEKPPWDTPLGGAIEIHGNQGDRGTAGCIAMTNDVMDILWNYCNLGVPVTVGP